MRLSEDVNVNLDITINDLVKHITVHLFIKRI